MQVCFNLSRTNPPALVSQISQVVLFEDCNCVSIDIFWRLEQNISVSFYFYPWHNSNGAVFIRPSEFPSFFLKVIPYAAPSLYRAHMTGSRSRQFLSLYFDSCYDTGINDLHEVCTVSGHLNHFKTELTLMLLMMLQTEKRLIFISKHI